MRAILDLPEMPDSCEKCRLCVEDCFGGYFCSGTTFDEESYKKSYIKLKGKPDWCPLREMPPRTDVYPEESGDEWAEGYVTGYNACLRDAEGSGEDETIDGEK